MVMRDLFTPDPAPMLPLEFPQVELEGRIRRLRSPRYVDYDAGNAILGRLAWLYDHPKVTRPPCSLVYSDTNNGKTALAHKFARDYSPMEDSPDYGKRPVLYVHAPPFADLIAIRERHAMLNQGKPGTYPMEDTSDIDQFITEVPDF
jgi:hypothetical protein